MNIVAIASLLLIVITLIVSFRGLTNLEFFDKYSFNVEKILVNKEYIRLLSSGFLHVSWWHLLGNMYVLYVFSGTVEMVMGNFTFLIIYFISLLGGNALSLFINRYHSSYTAVGASGAVSGIVFASIAIFPFRGVGLLFIPIRIWGWLFGLLYILYSIYGIRSKRDNIGHDAHLGGALLGVLAVIIAKPVILLHNYITILLIIVPTLAFIYIIITKPQLLFVDNLFYKNNQNYTLDDKYNDRKVNKQQELDNLLDKVSKKGLNSLSKKERSRLDELSR